MNRERAKEVIAYCRLAIDLLKIYCPVKDKFVEDLTKGLAEVMKEAERIEKIENGKSNINN